MRVRVLPDVSGIDKTFDYAVPERFQSTVTIGSLVRVDLNGRRVAAWVLAIDPPDTPAEVALRDISKVSSAGPPAEVVELAAWAAHRWGGRQATILKQAMPERMVSAYPAPSSDPVRALPIGDVEPLAIDAFGAPGVTLLQLPPSVDPVRVAIAAVATGDALIVTPDIATTRRMGTALRQAGARIGLSGRDFAQVAAGGSVIGPRSAVWSPLRNLAAVLVVDEHEESLQEERNPTWHARDVAIERARRAGVPCVLLSPAPSLAARSAADRTLGASRSAERRGWPQVTVIDQRDPEIRRHGLFTRQLVPHLRSGGRVLCVLNRKGRSPMLACASCGELVRTEDGEHLMTEIDAPEGERLLRAAVTGEERPMICATCGGTSLKRLRLGVNRAAEELTALAGEPVGDITAESTPEDIERHRILVGTEAVLRRVDEADVVAFLDFDQELLAPRYRAAEQALSLGTRASRLLMAGSSPGQLLIQTRTPDHRVIRALLTSNPATFADDESEVRKTLQFPPFGALAELIGAPASAFADALGERFDTTILGPRADGRYLVRTPDAASLATALSETPRPKGRLRVAVDPPRA